MEDAPPPPRTPASAEALEALRFQIFPPTDAEGSSTENRLAPLEGRRVLVPLTSKAFFEGTLRPETSATGATDGRNAAAATTTTENPQSDDRGGIEEGVSVDEERVLTNLGGGYLASMTRGDTDEFLRRRIDERRASGGERSGREKSGRRREKGVEGGTGDRGNATEENREAKLVGPSNPLPCFEIREECDASGRVVSGRAVNVSEELQVLKENISRKTSEGKGRSDELREISDLVGSLELGGAANTVAHDSSTAVGGETVKTKELISPKGPLPDEQYQSISDRLDLLARLEEEDEVRKKESADSSRGLRGKGWAKGFLSKKKKALPPNRTVATRGDGAILPHQTPTTGVRTTEVGAGGADPGGTGGHQLVRETATAASAQAPSRKSAKQKKEKASKTGGWSKGFLLEKPNANSKVQEMDVRRAKKKVAFGADEIREIPRIGDSSAREAISAQRTRSNPVQQRRQPKEFKKEAFSGVVKEKSSSVKTADGGSVRWVTNQITPSNTVVTAGSDQEDAPKKKLSRFAQQRQQMRS